MSDIFKVIIKLYLCALYCMEGGYLFELYCMEGQYLCELYFFIKLVFILVKYRTIHIRLCVTHVLFFFIRPFPVSSN